jgi:hypothetical protein
MELSSKALQDLRLTLRKVYGCDFDVELTDTEVNFIGVFFLTSLKEALMVRQ